VAGVFSLNKQGGSPQVGEIYLADRKILIPTHSQERLERLSAVSSQKKLIESPKIKRRADTVLKRGNKGKKALVLPSISRKLGQSRSRKSLPRKRRGSGEGSDNSEDSDGAYSSRIVNLHLNGDFGD
jgi:hypothetical protein